MKKNRLGQSDIYISELTLGCMSLHPDRQESNRLIEMAIEKGVNHLDTADLYDFGENEKMVGDAIKNKRHELIITTKVGNHFNKEKKDWFWDPSASYIQKEVKKSLMRLQTDYIDLYMLHGGTLDDPIEETVAAFEALKQEGTIRAYGISSIRPNVIKEFVNRSNIDAVMLQHSLLDRRAEEEILHILSDKQISVLSRGPLAKGILTDSGKEKLMEKHTNGYLDYDLDTLKSLLHELDSLKKGEESVNQLAIQYILRQPAVASVVFGASSIQQLDENIASLAPISDAVYEKLKHLTKQNLYTNHR